MRQDKRTDYQRHDPSEHLPGGRWPVYGRELRAVRNREREGRQRGGLRVRARWRLQAPHLPYSFQGLGEEGLRIMAEVN